MSAAPEFPPGYAHRPRHAAEDDPDDESVLDDEAIPDFPYASDHLLGHQGPWTAEDVFALPDNGRFNLYEAVEGVLFASPVPGYDRRQGELVPDPDDPYSSDHLLGHRGPWTAEDVFALPDNGLRERYEVIDGTLIVSPAPNVDHQEVCWWLTTHLKAAVRATNAPFRVLQGINVVRDEGPLVIPDIVIVPTEAAPRGTRTVKVPMRQVVCPIEIASPGSQLADHVLKPAVFARHGVPWYWRVELWPKPKVVVHELVDGKLKPAHIVTNDEQLGVDRPFKVEFAPIDLLGY